MEAVEPLPSIRTRIRELNTKAYYLLVALSFVYRLSTNSHLLKWALTLTALAAVFPVQDFVQSTFWLEVFRGMKVTSLVVALVLMICWIWMV